MIGGGHYLFWPKNRKSPLFQSLKCLRAGYFMNKVSVDIQYGRAFVDCFHYVRLPDFVE
jgi:hypothetical protein